MSDREVEVERPILADPDAYRVVKRDWVTLLAPALLASVLSGSVSFIGVAYMAGGLNQRVSTLEDRVAKVANDYIPRDTLEKQFQYQKEQNENTNRQLDRMADKLDSLLTRDATVDGRNAGLSRRR